MHSWPRWSARPPIIRRAIARPTPSAPLELLRQMGFPVEEHPVPADLVAAQGMVSVTNLIVRHRFGPGPVLALNAHGDVVPPGRGWSADPYGAEVRDGAMYGRGVAVSKSDFATYAFALKAIEASGVALRGTVELHFTYDEEAGGMLGPHWLLGTGVSRPDFAIAAGFSYSVVIAHNGCLHLEVQVRGRSAHAALPERGSDALEAAARLLAALYGLRDGYAAIRSAVPGIAHPTLVVGLISGGINTNVVPDLVTLRLDRRIIPEEDALEVERGLIAAIERAVAAPGITVDDAPHPACAAVRAAAGTGPSRRGHSEARARDLRHRAFRPKGCRFTPTPATTALPASRPCSTARGRARSPRRTATPPTSGSCSRICARRRRWSRSRSPIFSGELALDSLNEPLQA